LPKIFHNFLAFLLPPDVHPIKFVNFCHSQTKTFPTKSGRQETMTRMSTLPPF